MENIRRILLAIIGVLSGAWLGVDLLKRKATSVAHAAANPPQTAPAGSKGGAIALPRAQLPQKTSDSKRKASASRTAKSARDAEKPVSAPGGQESHSDVRDVDVHGPIGYIKELFKRFNGDHCPAWAAALSFFSILSFVPIL